MSHTSMILSALLLATMVLILAPRALAFNHGNILRNIAVWLAIFLGLALIYQNFGPGSPHPLFQEPSSMRNLKPLQIQPTEDPKDGDKDNGSTGYTPPKEE